MQMYRAVLPQVLGQEPDRLEITLATIMSNIINDEEESSEYGI